MGRLSESGIGAIEKAALTRFSFLKSALTRFFVRTPFCFGRPSFGRCERSLGSGLAYRGVFMFLRDDLDQERLPRRLIWPASSSA